MAKTHIFRNTSAFYLLVQFFLLIRGGIQQIPLNIASAYYSKNHISNDLAVNSVYYFTQSYLLHNRASIDDFMPDIKEKEAESIVKQLYNYPKTHTEFIFKNEKPNIVVVVLEGWSSNAISCLSKTKKAHLILTNLHLKGSYLVTFLHVAGLQK